MLKFAIAKIRWWFSMPIWSPELSGENFKIVTKRWMDKEPKWKTQAAQCAEKNAEVGKNA